MLLMAKWMIFWGKNDDQDGIQDKLKLLYTGVLAASVTPLFAVVVYCK